MNKNRLVEVVATIIFIGSLFLYLLFGFWYFAGLEYATPINKFIIIILTINIYLGLLYFCYRFIRWLIKTIKKNLR